MELSISDIRTIMVGWRDALSSAILALDPLVNEPAPSAVTAITATAAPQLPRAVSNLAKADKKPRVEHGDAGEAILAALRRKSPQSPGELAGSLKLSLFTLRRRLKPLVHNGAVTVSGTTGSRRVSLASGKPAKEAP